MFGSHDIWGMCKIFLPEQEGLASYHSASERDEAKLLGGWQSGVYIEGIGICKECI